jgi:NAD(P)-dependent dehydrogenase (short-subunit alcohol dehydrogenase family)
MATTRTALVTGGASGLGAAAAKRLRADGLQVTTLDLINADVTADVADFGPACCEIAESLLGSGDDHESVYAHRSSAIPRIPGLGAC